MPNKKKKQSGRVESPESSSLHLRAEPPSSDGFEAFYNELPAYLLAKVKAGEVMGVWLKRVCMIQWIFVVIALRIVSSVFFLDEERGEG